VLADGLWSPLTSATFKVVDQDPGLRLTELMYNPVGGGAYEFVELENTGSAPLNLAGAQFEGIDFTFPADMSPVLPGARVVFARNEAP
jgi:hypothetical protein